MSLFQCEKCGCCENTALSMQGFKLFSDSFDWEGKTELKGMMLCSACGPAKFSDGKTHDLAGKWHNQFPRVYLALGQWKTNGQGNLEHIETGETNYRDHALNINANESI